MPADPTLGSLGLSLSNMVGHWTSWHEDFQDWLTTPPTGGPFSDGKVYLRPANPEEAPILFPGLQWFMLTLKRGFSAANDLAFSYQGALGGTETLQTYVHSGEDTSIDLSKCLGTCDTKPAATLVIKITKDTFDWLTVTYTTGSYAPTFACSDPTLAHGSILRIVAPASADALFRNPAFTLAGTVS